MGDENINIQPGATVCSNNRGPRRVALAVRRHPEYVTLNVEQVRVVRDERPEYDGELTITPSKADQVLETEGKAITQDITVLAVPYVETGNVSGGYTAIIGG